MRTFYLPGIFYICVLLRSGAVIKFKKLSGFEEVNIYKWW